MDGAPAKRRSEEAAGLNSSKFLRKRPRRQLPPACKAVGHSRPRAGAIPQAQPVLLPAVMAHPGVHTSRPRVRAWDAEDLRSVVDTEGLLFTNILFIRLISVNSIDLSCFLYDLSFLRPSSKQCRFVLLYNARKTTQYFLCHLWLYSYSTTVDQYWLLSYFL